MRLPVTPDLHINAFSGAGITELESGVTNGMIEKRNGITYLTQRPSIDVFEDAGTHVADARGRGIYYWDTASDLYIVNNGTLYKGSQSSSLSTSPTAGTKPVKFLQLGSTLLLLDAENDQGFTITTGGTVAEITDTDFPPKQTPAVGLAYGGAVLDGYLFVLGEDGVVYNSNNGDATLWTALDFIAAEREEDGGVYLAKHYDNLAVFGNTTIEFFYDAANATGSPLSRRQDIHHNIGCSDGATVWEEGDRAFFVGVNYSGALGVYVLEQFQIRKISTGTIDSFITQAIVKDGFTAFASGISAQGHTFYLLTIYTTPSDITPDITLCYDDTTGLWSEWDITVNDITKFPVIGTTKRFGSTQRYVELILSNGDLLSINDDLSPQDTLLGSTYVATDYVNTGYVSESGDVGTNVALTSRLGQYDGGTNNYKYPTYLKPVHDRTPNSQTLTVKWANENNESFSTGIDLDTSLNNKVTRLGRFQRRNFELTYSGSDVLRIEGVDIDLGLGTN